MSNKKLLTNNNNLLKTNDDKTLLSDPQSVGKGLGESKCFFMRNNKLLFNGGHPLAFTDTVSPVLNENSWATISNVVQAGRTFEFWRIGDYKIVYRYPKDAWGNATSDVRVPCRLYLAGEVSYNNGIGVVTKVAFCNSAADVRVNTYIFEGTENYDENNGYYSLLLSGYAGSRWGSGATSQIQRFLAAEALDIGGGAAREVTNHTEVWQDWNINLFNTANDLYMADGIYNTTASLHLPSIYEMTGDVNYKEKKLIDKWYLEDNSEYFTRYAIDTSDASLVHDELSQIEIFKPRHRGKLLVGERGTIDNAVFISRTAHGTIQHNSYVGYPAFYGLEYLSGNVDVYESIYNNPPPWNIVYTYLV